VDPLFLTLDEVLALHEDQIRRYGGSHGVRDIGLLESALGNAAATFDGEYLNQTIFEMAAAILYGICRNHPFVDGNKRASVAAALVFLEMNGVTVDADQSVFYDLVIGAAEGRASKAQIAVFFENHS